jgi:predicted HicB family RNase H-like nuclease
MSKKAQKADPDDPSVGLSLRIPQSLHRRMKRYAKARNTSLTHIVVMAVRTHLSRRKPLDD